LGKEGPSQVNNEDIKQQIRSDGFTYTHKNRDLTEGMGNAFARTSAENFASLKS